MAFTLLPLPYAYDALEPHFDKTTMEIHHDKHHQGYVNNLNNAIANTPNAEKSLDELVSEAGILGNAIRNNAGGHWNHTFFWNILHRSQNAEPKGKLLEDIKNTFGSFNAFKEKFNQAALSRFGSGWAWCIVQNKKLVITSTANQDNPLMDIAELKGLPILGIDVWEHAYYLKYQNKRADYLNAFWNLVNWEVVTKQYEKTLE